MSIKIDERLKKELEEFKEQILKSEAKWVNESQEIIFTTLSLLVNPEFRKTISKLRNDYEVPQEWYTTKKSKDLYDEWWDWHEKNNYKYPYYHLDNRILKLCCKFKVNPKRYGAFILDYLYFGNILSIRPPNFEYFNAKGEFRYKARIEVDYGDEETETNYPQKSYIRFFKDTTKNKLIKFIKDNWDAIKQIQSDLQPYPHPKRYGSFKRDIQVYLLHLLGSRTPKILEILEEENIPKEDRSLTEEENAYYLDDSSVRQIIKDVEDKIKTISE